MTKLTEDEVRDLMEDHDRGDWISCWSCGGEGHHDDCFECTCVCLDPPCMITRCDVCKGNGGWERED